MTIKHLVLSMLLLTLSVGLVSAQDESDGDSGKKDKKNQVKYLESEKGDNDFSYEDRKEVHKLLMPRYDLDTLQNFHTKKKAEQQKAYMDQDYYYPEKPRNQWELGLGVNYIAVSGDVQGQFSPLDNWGANISLRKSLGYVVSLRLQYTYMNAKGADWEPSSNTLNNPALNGDYPDAPDYSTELIFHNYEFNAHDLSLQALVNLNNFKFHKERNSTSVYLIGGIDAVLYDTKMDQLDADGNQYDYTNAYDIWAAGAPTNPDDNYRGVKADVYDELEGIRDDEYESDAHTDPSAIILLDRTFRPAFTAGLGVQFHITKRFTLGLEGRAIIMGDDFVDGQVYESNDPTQLSADKDNIVTGSLNLNFHLFKNAVEPLHWMNPMDYTYKKIGEMDPEKIINDFIQDDDEDGVPNKLDQEAETPKDCPVNPKGIALDSDGDGCIDCEDAEPFSPPGYPIDENCVAIVPDPACCDKAGFDCSKITLPSIHFASDRYGLSPEYYATLHIVAERMQMCPDATIVATGFADSHSNQKYNEQLSWNRVNAAVEYLVETYGISRDRFIVDYKGESEASEGTDKENRKVAFRIADDGETGDSNPPAPHPGLKAGKE